MAALQEAKDVGDEFLALEKFVNLNYLVGTLPFMLPRNSWIILLHCRKNLICVLCGADDCINSHPATFTS